MLEKIIIETEDGQEEYIKVSELIRVLNNFCQNYYDKGYHLEEKKFLIEFEKVTYLFLTLLMELETTDWGEISEEIIYH